MHQVVVPICPLDDWKSWHNSSVVHPYCSWQCPNVKSLLSIFFFLYPLWHLKHFLRELCNRVAIILKVFCCTLNISEVSVRYLVCTLAVGKDFFIFDNVFKKNVDIRKLICIEDFFKCTRKINRNIYPKSFKWNSQRRFLGKKMQYYRFSLFFLFVVKVTKIQIVYTISLFIQKRDRKLLVEKH